MGQRILITGVSRHLPGRLAQRLEQDPDVDHIVGIDVEEPEVDLERTEYVRADIRNPLILKTIQASEADTVVHLSVITTPTRVGGRLNMKDINVIGSMQLFAACQKAPEVKKLVMKSSTAVYGSSPLDPAVFTEDMSARAAPVGYAKDSIEIEEYARDFGRRRKDVSLTILRFANFMGSGIETTLTRYFSLPVIPSPFGYDPRLQFIHEDDALEVLYRAVREDHKGIFNVAADGVLYLSQAIRMCGKLPFKVLYPFGMPLAALIRRAGLVDFPTDQIDYLVYGRVADNERLKSIFGYTPRFTTREALEEFIAGQRFRRLFTPEQASEWERNVYDLLQRGRRDRRQKVRT
ncbi:MAG TPA: SDR family oxidoreductase [Actinomycetota bacterium]|nr:SDR family oxidoreductase [Actinomycetota bacterium]